jgi:TATA-box binding protein (TBP) (component of TFIID and TFIIIB)
MSLTLPTGILMVMMTTMMLVKSVNEVWRGQMNVPVVDLAMLRRRLAVNKAVNSIIQTVRHQTRQPEQLIIKFRDASTMLMFKSGKFRIMGGADSLDMHFNIYRVTCMFNCVPDVLFQTMTATCQFPHTINLNSLTTLPSRYNPEIFPALQLLSYKPISVNVFASGKVTICGLKELDFAQQVIVPALQQCMSQSPPPATPSNHLLTCPAK